MLTMGAYGRGWYQLALGIAAVYEIEFGDDSLNIEVRHGLDELGVGDLETRVVAVDGADARPVEPAAPPERLIHLQVGEDQLRDLDIYPLVRVFSHKYVETTDDLERLAAWRGRVLITFAVPLSDPREVWEVPEVRAFVRAVSKAMPYFPFYLTGDSRYGMFLVYYGSLAEETAAAGPGRLDLFEESMVVEVAASLVSVQGLCEALGTEWRTVAVELLAACPPEFVTRVIDLAAQAVATRTLGTDAVAAPPAEGV
jgi:hypothetical protein